MRLRARIPAASGNLGSGFDVSGMALSLYNEAVVDTEERGVRIEGEGAGVLPADDRNLCIRAMHELSRRAGRVLPEFGLTLTNRIPIGRGLASSGAGALAGLLLANALLDEPCDRDDLMRLATELEGHPDNVAAAILGGITVSVWDGEAVHAVQIEPPVDVCCVLWVPDSEVYTRQARAILPRQVPMQDAVFNLGRAALFAAALATGRLEHLRVGAGDRLHQPYRASMAPGLEDAMSAALDAGALASWLSGAGPSVLALCQGDTERVESALREVIRQHGGGRVLRLEIDLEGAQVIRE